MMLSTFLHLLLLTVASSALDTSPEGGFAKSGLNLIMVRSQDGDLQSLIQRIALSGEWSTMAGASSLRW